MTNEEGSNHCLVQWEEGGKSGYSTLQQETKERKVRKLIYFLPLQAQIPLPAQLNILSALN